MSYHDQLAELANSIRDIIRAQPTDLARLRIANHIHVDIATLTGFIVTLSAETEPAAEAPARAPAGASRAKSPSAPKHGRSNCKS